MTTEKVPQLQHVNFSVYTQGAHIITQERALRIVHKDSHSEFETLLVNQNLASVNQRNLRLLLTEIYKRKSRNAPSFMKEIFIEKVPSYELRDGGNICLPKVKTTRFGRETVRFLRQKLWRTLPADKGI